MHKNIGIEAKPPAQACEDKNCCWHGDVRIRGRIFEGVVVSAKARRTAVVEIPYFHYVPKYERYERRTSRITCHNPDCVGAKEGDRVRIGECRPLSKTKHHIIFEKL